MKVGLRLLLIGVDGSDEDGAEMRIRCGCGGRLGHSNALVSAGNAEGDREPVNADRHCLVGVYESENRQGY